VEMSSVIPGQPMPGPEYMAATRSDDVGSPTLAQQALIAARQAYLQQQAAATAAVAAACTPSAAQLASPVQAAAPTSPAAHTDLLLRLSEPAPAPQMPQPLSPHMAVPAQQPTAVPDLEGQAAPVAQGSPDSVQVCSARATSLHAHTLNIHTHTHTHTHHVTTTYCCPLAPLEGAQGLSGTADRPAA
jgi:hypothetical protein